MIITKADTLLEYQMIRALRNKVASFMTNNSSYISSRLQAEFYNQNRNYNNMQIYTYYDEYSAFIGYGLLRRISGKWYGTLAVEEEFRSLGYGTKIYKHLQDACTEDLWLEIFIDNNASIRAALKAGFVITDLVKDKTLTLVYRKDKE